MSKPDIVLTESSKCSPSLMLRRFQTTIEGITGNFLYFQSAIKFNLSCYFSLQLFTKPDITAKYEEAIADAAKHILPVDTS